MPKKKKTVKRKKPLALNTERSPFWAYAGAILFMLLALFLLLGGFNSGGPLPVNLFHGAYWTFGWVAYLTPIALIYWGIYKFMAEDRRIPLSKLSAMLALLILSSAWAYVAFVTKNRTKNWIGGHGGMVGKGIGSVVLNVLDKIPAAFACCVFTL